MKHPLRRLLVASLAIAALTVAGSARADFDILITSGGQSVATIIDGGPGDSNGGLANNISVSGQDLADLNQALQTIAPGLSFTSLGATNNSADIDPSGTASLTVTGAVAGVGSVEILVSANGFLFPTGDPKTISSSASDTFGTLGGTRDFTSYYNPSNGLNDRIFGTQVLMFAPSPGQFSTSGTASPLVLSGTAVPYSLSNYTTITLTGTGASDQFTGLTTVSANVPEPTSMALVLIGGSALAFRNRRRFKATA